MIPKSVKTALDHVRIFHPEICMVVFNTDTRWRYVDENFTAPAFDDRVSTSILEHAVDDLDEFPCVFQLEDND